MGFGVTGLLGDYLADDVVDEVDYDFAGLGVQTSVACQTAHAGLGPHPSGWS
jgi:hypothetical protein